MVRVIFNGSKPEVVLGEVRSALDQDGITGVQLTFDGVQYLSPAALLALESSRNMAEAAGKELLVDGVDPQLYKALHIANLGSLLVRIHRGTEGLGVTPA